MYKNMNMNKKIYLLNERMKNIYEYSNYKIKNKWIFEYLKSHINK